MQRFRVVKSVKRNYGYSLQDTMPSLKPNQYLHPTNIFGWYKSKREAMQRADELNKCHETVTKPVY